MTRAQRTIILADARLRSLRYWYYVQQNQSSATYNFDQFKLSEMFGTPDRLPPKPYVRESLRLKAAYMTRQQDTQAYNGSTGYARIMFPDTVLCFEFEYDFHPTRRSFHTGPTDGTWHGDFRGARGFGNGGSGRATLPLRSLIPIQMDGLIAAQKSLGYTSIVSSALRLHDQSVAVGQAAGAAAAVALKEGTAPRHLPWDAGLMALVWNGLLAPEDEGVSATLWPFDDLDPTHAAFAAVQQLAVRGLLPLHATEVSFHAGAAPATSWIVALHDRLNSHGYTLSVEFLHPAPATRGEAVMDAWAAIATQPEPVWSRLNAADADLDGLPDGEDPLPFSALKTSWAIAIKVPLGLSIAEFGDLAPGMLNGQAGGAGFAGSWGDAGSESTTLQVEATDYKSSRYYLPAAGEATRSAGAPDDNPETVGHISRTFDVAKTGTVWFTYIAYRENASCEGISFNETGANANLGNRILFVEDQLQVTLGGTVVTNISGKVSDGISYLVLGQVVVNPSSNDTLRMWFNPDLTGITSPAGLPTADVNDMSADFAGSAWERVGLIAYTSSGGSGGLDHLRVSDSGTAFADVTGVLKTRGFDPRRIPSLRLWVRADTGAYTAGSLPADNGQTVRVLADHSHTLAHPGQLAAGARPIYSANAINGLPTIHFEGSSQFFGFGPTPIINLDDGERWTVFAVARPNVLNNVAILGLRDGSNPPLVQLDQDSAGKPRMIARDSNSTTASSLANVAAMPGRFAVYAGTLRGPKSNMTAQVYYNGVPGTAATANFTGSLNASEQRIGGLNGGMQYYWDGDIAELLIFAEALDAERRSEVGFYLANKYRIATAYREPGTMIIVR